MKGKEMTKEITVQYGIVSMVSVIVTSKTIHLVTKPILMDPAARMLLKFMKKEIEYYPGDKNDEVLNVLNHYNDEEMIAILKETGAVEHFHTIYKLVDLPEGCEPTGYLLHLNRCSEKHIPPTQKEDTIKILDYYIQD